MSETKVRLSASVDAELIAAGHRAVRAGLAPNLSAWVNAALTRQIEHDERLEALGEFVTAYEAEFGVIDDAELADAARRDKANAVVVRGKPKRRVRA